MTVKELRKALKKFSPDLEITITDGINGVCYKGDFEIGKFNFDGLKSVDIGVGGLSFDC